MFTFGRMNPPTVGHEKLVDKVKAEAKGGPALVYLSHSQKPTTDPLSYPDKVKYATTAFGRVVKRSNARTIIEVMKELEKKYSAVKLVVGSDRVTEFKTLLNRYNGKDYNFDKIEVVSAGQRDPDAEGVSGMSASKMRAAVKDNMFATFRMGLPQKLKNKDLEIFKKVRDGMGISESLDLRPKGRPFTFDLTTIEKLEEMDDDELEKLLQKMDDEDAEDLGIDMAKFIDSLDDEDLDEERKPLTIQQRRKIGLRMRRLAPRMARFRAIKKKRMATPDRLLFRARRKAVEFIRTKVAGTKGAKYRELSPSEKIGIDRMIMKKRPMIARIAKRLMPKVKKAELERLKKARQGTNEERTPQDKDIADKKGTQPAKYHKGLKPSTKSARDSQFKRQTKMDDDNPAAYKDAPGDKAARKKGMPLSKYTKQYRATYGESYNNWTNEEPVEYAKHLTKTFGTPDEMTNSQLWWFSKDGFKRIVVKDEYILHGSPAPHYDFIYCYVDIDVPEEMANDLANSSGSILIDFLKGEVGARCGSITANACTLNYVLDVVAGRAQPSKKEYEKRILEMKDMFSKGETWSVDWWPDETGDANPKNKYYAECMMGCHCGQEIMEDVAGTRERHKREKEALKRDHDRELDAARLRDTRDKNREEEARGRPKKGTKGDDEDIEHIQIQLRKAINLRGMKKVQFKDGKSTQVSPGTARKVLDRIDKTRNTTEKQKLVRFASMSLDNLNTVASGKPLPAKVDKLAIPTRIRSNFPDTARVSGIVGSNDINERFEGIFEKAKDVNAFFEEYLDEKRNIKSFKNVARSSIVPRDNYLLEKDMEGLKKKASKTGISYATLKKVYDRGVAAWRTGHRPGTTPSQWGYGRVNAFIAKKKSGKLNHDQDLAHREFFQGQLMAEVEIRKADFLAHERGEMSLDDLAKKYREQKGRISGELNLMRDHQRNNPKVFNAMESKEPSMVNVLKVMGPTKNAKEGIAAIKRVFKVNDKKAEQLLDKAIKDVLGEELNEISTDVINRYYKMSKQSRDKATNSAIATILRKGDHSKDLKTRSKREKGMKMAKSRAVARLRGESYNGNEVGTKELTNKYKNMTPGQNEDMMQKKIDKRVKKLGFNPNADLPRLSKKQYEGHGGEHQSSGRSMTDSEKKKREDIKKGLMKNKSDFKDRYGKDADSVMNALATKMAMKNEEFESYLKENNLEACCDDCFDHVISEATYNGKTVKLNDPIRTSEVPTKKFKVYVKDGDKVKVVRFGDPNLSIKRDDPDRRKSFRARHNCDNPGPKTKPRYWSCFQWRGGSKVDS